MIRKLNRRVQDYLRPKRLAFGRWLWDKKKKRYLEFITRENILNMSKVKSILFLRYDGKIGDMVVNTFMFREIKKRYPSIKIGVVARGEAKKIIKYNPYIDDIYSYIKGKEKEVAKQVEGKYDIVVDFNELMRVNHMKLLYLCKGKINIGLEKKEWELFDLSYEKERKKHISETYKNLLKLFGIVSIDTKYDIFVSDEEKRSLEKKLKDIKKFIVLNPYAASKYRCFNEKKIREIIDYTLKKYDKKIIVIGEKKREEEIKKIISDYKDKVLYIELDGILEVVELIGRADYLITPDTSIVHIGVAKDIFMCAVYREDRDEDLNSIVWAPNSEKARQIFSKDRVKAKGEEVDINIFEVSELY